MIAAGTIIVASAVPLPGRPISKSSANAREPWLDIGMSRRTYYRRKAAGALPEPEGPQQHCAHVLAWFATLGSFAKLDHLSFARRCSRGLAS